MDLTTGEGSICFFSAFAQEEHLKETNSGTSN